MNGRTEMTSREFVRRTAAAASTEVKTAGRVLCAAREELLRTIAEGDSLVIFRLGKFFPAKGNRLHGRAATCRRPGFAPGIAFKQEQGGSRK